jgi:hypothetical protein
MSEITCPNKTRTRFSGSPDYFIKGLAPYDEYYDTNKWKALFKEVFIPAYLDGYAPLIRDMTFGYDTNLIKFGSMLEFIDYNRLSFNYSAGLPPEKVSYMFASGTTGILILYTNNEDLGKSFGQNIPNQTYLGQKVTNIWQTILKMTKKDGSIIEIDPVMIYEIGSLELYIILIIDRVNRLGMPSNAIDIDFINPITIDASVFNISGSLNFMLYEHLTKLKDKYLLYDDKLSLVTSLPSTLQDDRVIMITHENLYNPSGSMMYDAFGVEGTVYKLRSGLDILVPNLSKYPCFKILGFNRNISAVIDDWMSYACAGAVIQQPQVQTGQLPSWLIPALIIGGGIGIGALAYYLYKKR